MEDREKRIILTVADTGRGMSSYTLSQDLCAVLHNQRPTKEMASDFGSAAESSTGIAAVLECPLALVGGTGSGTVFALFLPIDTRNPSPNDCAASLLFFRQARRMA